MTGLTNTEIARIQNLIKNNTETIEWTRKQLACNFDVPAQRTINYACSKMGCSRLDWEKIECVMYNWNFEPVPANILSRWESY